ncbi:aminotransferase class I/II-fold pyridoxal phosphate-dependent enzyme [Streptomyces diacarni]|uniref:Aminotransferase class I/II-fold pyridoxal phosphate-dependent enzyme n=1 Tax=Streptomyces diacarni TaxID=2800381 RepID=A0A367EUA0_9ACTN|nr:type I polyketide synthase [Streptomyces diacarni]RCG21309.1 aminotransferase class I/II-fold pyridoxal phosphate-dependent enzyme [Streptomyces diacarni]
MTPEPIETHWQGAEPATVAGLLRRRLELTPHAVAYRFLTDTGGRSESWDYAGLDRRARAVAAYLQQERLEGSPVLLLHPPGLDYVASFFGCLYAGAVAVPAYPPQSAGSGQTMQRLAGIARDSGATHALTTRAVRDAAHGTPEKAAGLGLDRLCWVTEDELRESDGDQWVEPSTTSESLAFLQYTSGSTATPKGVMVSNGNLVRNLRSSHLRLELDSGAGMVSWLPPYHDMGLIGGLLTPVYGGFSSHLMAPMTFVQRPLLWLETLSETRASMSVAPNFGFEQCLRRITEQQRDALDLSDWRLALNGAEPVRADTLERFADYFGPAGFDRRALLPCYGLAEATLMATGIGPGDPPTDRSVDAQALARGAVRDAEPGCAHVTRVVGCGPAVPDARVAVVDSAGKRVGSERIGEVWLAGPSVALGYWNRPELTAETFGAKLADEPGRSWLRTGDLGFQRDGQLYLVGRTKDVVIVQGRNVYPHDIELTVEQTSEAARADCGAAFGLPTPGGEQLALVYEVGRGSEDLTSVLARLRTALAEEHEVCPHTLALVRHSSVSKTTSGKVQRQATRQDFLDLRMPVVAASVVRDTGTPAPAGEGGATSPSTDLSGLSVTARRSRVTELVEESIEEAAGSTAEEGRGPRDLASLGLDYPRLLELVAVLEQRLGVRIAVGELLVAPQVDTLVELCLDELRGARHQPAPGGPARQASRLGTGADHEKNGEELEAWLHERVARRLGLPASVVDPTRTLSSLGLDSKQAVAVASELGDRLGRRLPTGTVFDHPTIRDLATHFGAEPAPHAVAVPRAGGPTDPHEPIAIVGIGCRFPGAPDLDSYWRLLLDGRDAVGEMPHGRWNAREAGTSDQGGFLDAVDEFDARFFGISAREALRMDPQQRMLLEVAWQTFEDAGIAPDRLAGSDTAVVVGVSSQDYGQLQLGSPRETDVYAATGNAPAMAANRLSYFFDLRGPSFVVDTACSASLAGVHMACQSLWRGESRIALAGGANLLLAPGLSAALLDGEMLSPGGRCRTFDDAADGYVRGEGVGLLCLKPLSDALADGDRIHATVLGSALAHGGRGNGLTAPRSAAQRDVIIGALAQAGVEADRVDYVEAHGTGTSLGDPVEWEALAEVYGGAGREEPCLVGSVKTNIGHLEAAAGVAGLIKAALIVGRREVPPLLHLDKPNRLLDWEGSGLSVPTERRSLPPGETARAGVSSFGFGGANAHLIVEEPPAAPSPSGAAEEEKPVTVPRPAHTLCLSGHTPSALATLAHRYRTHVAARPDEPLAGLCRTANTGRTHLAYRAAVTFGTSAELDSGLAALAHGEASTAVARGGPGDPAPTVAFLFSGQGTQHPGMGRELYECHGAFAETLDHADRIARPLLGISLRDLLFDEEGGERLRRTEYCQPALVAFSVALARVWASAGVQPAAVLGHSVGAIGAACVSGVLSFEDALTLAVERGRLMGAQPGHGRMIACQGESDAVLTVAADFPSISVAAVNADRYLVLSGPTDDIGAVGDRLAEQQTDVRALNVSHAFHSRLMDGAAAPLREALTGFTFGRPTIPWVSDATGELVDRVDADYWARHMVGTVRFADAFTTLRGLGCDAFVEVGPHPALLSSGRSLMQDRATAPEGLLWLPSARRATGEWATFLGSLSRLHCAGCDVDWRGLDPEDPQPRVSAPHTVFERDSYWFTPSAAEPAAGGGPERPGRDGKGRPEAREHPHIPGRAPFGPVASPAPSPQDAAALRTTLEGAPADEPRSAQGSTSGVAEAVLDSVARVCGFPATQIPLHARLVLDLGLDSLMRTDLQRRISACFPLEAERLRHSLPEEPTVRDVIDLLLSAGAGRGGATGHPADPSAAPTGGAAGPSDRPPHPAVQPQLPVRQEHAIEEWQEYVELQSRLRQTVAHGDNPYGRTHEGFNSGIVTVDGREAVNFAAFNYLALSHHPRVRQAAKEAIDTYGTSSSATPLLFGETPLHHELDAEIASFLGTDDAIVFAGGHATNVATVGHLFGPEDLIVHDEWSHDSTVRGCILSGAQRRPFPHNDWEALDRILAASRSRYRRALVVIEGAYSQDGDIPELPRFIEVKQRHHAMLMIDEAHSLGVLGATGRGVGEHFGVRRTDVELWMGTLSKAIGSLGGYIAARRPLIEYLKYTAPLHIFSTGIAPANTAAALEALRVIRDEPERVARVRQLAEYFRTGARDRGLDIGVSRASAVIPVIVGDWNKTMALSNSLLEQGVNVMPIGYPAVAADACRLRFFINADHSEADLERSLDLLV